MFFSQFESTRKTSVRCHGVLWSGHHRSTKKKKKKVNYILNLNFNQDVVNRAVEHGGRCMLNELFAVNIGLDLASGLAHLHRKGKKKKNIWFFTFFHFFFFDLKGIIHRDVKSANFLVDQDNRVKMIDFGVINKMIGLLLFKLFLFDKCLKRFLKCKSILKWWQKLELQFGYKQKKEEKKSYSLY